MQQELSADDRARRLDSSHGRIARQQLEAEDMNGATTRARRSETADEREALRDELAGVRGELDAARASIAAALREVKTMEARAVTEREGTRKALTRILQLNEAVLSSAVSAVRAEEERSVFFQEATLFEFLSRDKNLEVIRRQMEGMERELVAQTVEIECLRSELNRTKEKYLEDCPVRACEAGSVTDQEPKVDASFAVLESSRDDFQSVRSDGKDVSIGGMPEHVAGHQLGPGAPTPTPRGGNSGTCVAAKESISNDGDVLYTKALDPEQGDELKLAGYVLDAGQGAATGEADAVRDELLGAARAEISDLRSSLEEAEEAKAALERELRGEIRNKHPSRRRAALSDPEDARRPARQMPPPTPAPPPGGEGAPTPTPRRVPLGKVLNMKYNYK